MTPQGQSYGFLNCAQRLRLCAYDGFGNLLDQTIIKGTGPSESTTYDYTNNRQTGEGADANGNINSGTGYYYNVFDIENRMVHPGATTAYYAYNAGNKRVWRGDSSVSLDEIDFYSAAGLKLGAYQVSVSGTTLKFSMTSVYAYLGGKLVSKGAPGPGSTTDNVNLASVSADGLGSIGKFYPYGLEKPSATTNDTEKFTGYFRDAATGFDYADQRYHQPGMGRFMTPDPDSGSAKLNYPGTWNRYAYVSGDPVNATDPTGLDCNGDPGLMDASCGHNGDGNLIGTDGFGGYDPNLSSTINTQMILGANGETVLVNNGQLVDVTSVTVADSGTAVWSQYQDTSFSQVIFDSPGKTSSADQDSQQTAQESALHCANRIASGFSIAGVIESGFNTNKHPYATWALDALVGNTFAGIASISEDFRTDPIKTYGDIVGGGISQGLPVIGEHLTKAGIPTMVAKGVFGAATDIALSATNPLGLGKLGFDALAYLGSFAYCATH